MNSKAILATAVACLCVSSVQSASADDLTYEWYTVANNGDVMPTDSSSNCGSCHEDMASSGGQASAGTKSSTATTSRPSTRQASSCSVRAAAAARAADRRQGEPERGIYMRNLAEQGPLYTVFRRSGTVPQPNNTTIRNTDQLASFNEFPSVPRIDAGSDTIATRGQSHAVVDVYLPDGTETRTGTAGIYTSSGHGMPTTGASMLGDVYEGGVQTFPYFQVPVHGAVPAGHRLRPVPGLARGHRAQHDRVQGQFRGGRRWQDGRLLPDFAANGGTAPIELIASSFTKIPGNRTT